RNEHPEPTLRRRAMAALFVAYVDDLDPPRPAPAALRPHVQHLAAIIRDYGQPAGNINDAFALLGVAGPPDCVAPLQDLVAHPREEEAFLWVAVQKGVQCAGAERVGEIVAAMPTDRGYER